MQIIPKNFQNAKELVREILIQGDSRYNDFNEEVLLSYALLGGAILLYEKELPFIKKPKKDEINSIWGVQKIEKYIAKNLLNERGFLDNEIIFEASFRGLRPDVLAEKERLSIIVECLSCKVSKILDFLHKAEEIWIITGGDSLWQKPLYNQKIQWFIFKKGPNFNKFLESYKRKQLKELKKIPSPIDELMK